LYKNKGKREETRKQKDVSICHKKVRHATHKKNWALPVTTKGSAWFFACCVLPVACVVSSNSIQQE
jgi:hypothetical protein